MVSEAELSSGSVAGWLELHQSLSPCVPFTSPLWNALWWKHYRSKRLSVTDEHFVLAVRDAAGTLRGIAPMMTTTRPGVGPLRVRALNCFGADPNVTELRGLVCRQEDEVAVLRALRSYLHERASRWDWIDWGAVRLASVATLKKELGEVCSIFDSDLTNYYLNLPSTWPEFRAGLSRNTKEAIRKSYNSLRRAGLSAEFRVIADWRDCEKALEAFFSLHASRGCAEDMVRHPDVFRGPVDRAFLIDFAGAMARRGQLRVFQLVISGSVVATRVGFLYGDELYLYYSGYDLDMGQHSVMTRTLVETFQWAISEGVRVVNLSAGTDRSKLRWGPAAVEFRTLIEVSPGWRARVAFSLYQKSRAVAGYPRIGRLLTWFGKR